MYDPRHSFKAAAGEALTMGESVYISTDGEVYAVDNGKSTICHGWVLEDAAENDYVTVVIYCRMRLDTTQTIGALVYTGAVSGGSPPSTTLAAAGVVVGFAIAADMVLLHTTFPPPAAG